MEFFTNLLSIPSSERAGRSVQQVLSDLDSNWNIVKDTLTTPDERQLLRGIQATDVPKRLSRIVDTLVLESGRYEDIEETPPALDWFLSQGMYQHLRTTIPHLPALLDILSKLVFLSASDRPLGIKTEVLKAVSNLCVTMQSHFFVQAPVHKPLVHLLKICTGDDLPSPRSTTLKGAASTAGTSQPSQYEEHLVDLLCILCNKIKSSPSLLHIFFLDRSWIRYPTRSRADSEHSDRPESLASTNTITSRAVSTKSDSEFLIFTYLLRWVHREGRTGDLARAAILILFEVSTSEDIYDGDAITKDAATDIRAAVAEFIVDGDLAQVLAAGLGAVYGILPSNLAVIPTDPRDEDRSHVHLSNRSGLVENVELSTSIAFQNQLSVFINITKRGLKSGTKYGGAVAENVLRAVRVNFFTNVLYPSILECSSIDYSAVAVITYLQVMLQCVKSGDPLANTLLQYLFAEDDSMLNDTTSSTENTPTNSTESTSYKTNTKPKKHERRRSTALVLLQNENAANFKNTNYVSSYGRFTLKDLISINLKSNNSATGVAAMKLFSYLIYAYDDVCLKEMVSIIPNKDATAFPYFHRIHMLMKDNDHYRKLEESEGESGSKSESKNENVFPIPPPMRNVEADDDELTSYLGLVGSIDVQTTKEMLSSGYERYLDDAQALIMSHPQFKLGSRGDVRDDELQFQHKLDTNDRLLKLTVKNLRNFFTQSPETNIALSGTLAALASNPRRSLEGFMTQWWRDEDDPYADDLTSAVEKTPNSPPMILQTLTELVDQIEDYRLQARNNISSQDLDYSLGERRKGMLFKENLQDALTLLDKDEPAQRNDLVRQFEEGVSKAVMQLHNKRFNQQRKKTYGEINKLSHRRYQDSIDTEFERRVERGNSWGISNLTAKADQFIRQPKTRSATTSLAALFTGKKGQTEQNVNTYKNNKKHRQVSAFDGPATPFYDHYKQTEQCLIIPKVVERVQRVGDSIPEDDEKGEQDAAVKPITLSDILDNVVILEEMLKDLIAIMQIRRSNGIDLVCVL
ncbi:hypothetical protein E3P89_03347 [Wallemia ichthyophaga]|uniref:Uncharacterized protein n=1 Tax=Wallemia ichthyophaga TaxID=245174 RepID=A0A4T0H1G5_WALIC|nr:hypothetical protein E3P93_03330 [Wallemia ichthyophaga]TIB09270.1 hypothetical protein E3P90_03329 [Wallemia ichthyophaga]TIB20202.1 hypothetical protein E3P89_03347 [Wallemia ichthyophaga]TIB21713.1 hypothetical protein E3P88_03342 [Wallemia ichthyophaga]